MPDYTEWMQLAIPGWPLLCDNGTGARFSMRFTYYQEQKTKKKKKKKKKHTHTKEQTSNENAIDNIRYTCNIKKYK